MKRTKSNSKKKEKNKGKRLSDIICHYCPDCHFTTESRVEYTKHILEHKFDVKVCIICGFETNERRLFIKHMSKHKNGNMYKCHFCSFKSHNEAGLSLHLMSHDDDILTCQHCTFETINKKKMKKHSKKHKAKKPLKCYECHRSITKRSRKSHLNAHDTNSDDVFPTDSSLGTGA